MLEKLPLSTSTWPALRRFGSIHSHPQKKKSWDSLIEKFREQYVPTNTAYEPALNPRL